MALQLVVTEDQRRECIVALARSCEQSLWLSNAVGRTGTVRERYVGMAEHTRDARLYANCAMTWATREVAA